MSETLTEYEGTILPHFLSSGGGEQSGFIAGSQMPGVLPGRIVTAYPPDHVLNRSKTFMEYDVLVERKVSNGIVTRTLIPRCRVGSLFGGVADYETWTPRLKAAEDAEDGSVDVGSQVLVVCVNDSTQDGIIICGIPHSRSATKTVVDGDDDHNWVRRFNGVEQSINKYGEFTLTFTGRTNAAGELEASEEASGSQMIFSKDGSIKLQTKDGIQFIHIDHTNKKLDISADTDWTTTVNGTWNVTTQGVVTHETRAASYTVNAPAGMCHLNGVLGTKLGAGTNQMLMGTTYRTAEITKNTARITGFTALAAQLGAAGAALATAGGTLTAASALHKIPVVGPVLGSAPLQVAATAIIAAGTALTALAATVTASLVAPLSAFEAGTPTYLSLLNSLD